MGEDTENLITYGNYLHRSAIATGVFAIFSGVYWQDYRFLPLPFGFSSCLCATLYAVCWDFDPCSNYKIDRVSPICPQTQCTERILNKIAKPIKKPFLDERAHQRFKRSFTRNHRLNGIESST